MALVRGAGGFVDDPWIVVAADEPVPPQKPVIVSLERWTEARESLLAREAPLGLRLESHEKPEDIARDLGTFQVIALVFPTFKDGRAYSSARLLRERYGYRGELRAVGNVLRDQLLFMLRCGFDTFEVDPERYEREDWQAAFKEFSIFYQPATDERTPVTALRHPRSRK